MKLVIFNADFPKDPKYNRIIEGCNMPIPHKGDRILLGYNPAPIVKNVIYDYDNNEILIEVGSATNML